MNEGVSLPCRVFRDQSNMAVEITFGEAYEIEGFIMLSGPRERGMLCHTGTTQAQPSSLNVTRSRSGEAWRGNSLQEPALLYWCTWSPGRGAHSLFVGMLRQQENMTLKKLLIWLCPFF